jgi:OOP family OmpA-OmpF porin
MRAISRPEQLIVSILFVLASVLVATTSQAQVEGGTISLNPHMGGYAFGGEQDLKGGGAFGVGVGYNFDEHWAAELVFDYIDSESELTGESVNVYQYRAEGLYHLMPDKRFVPFVAAGLGGNSFDPAFSSSDTDFLLDYGVGAKYFLTQSVALRADARHIISFDNTHNNFLGVVGLTWVFGGGKKAAAMKVAVVEPGDRDRDGVTDDKDRCPNTPRGVSVDRDGCPPDSDGDGVTDSYDQCPNSPKGAKVDSRGCWVLTGVRFDTGKATLQSGSNAVLDPVVKVLVQNPKLKVEVAGHTDSTGSAELNDKLSAARANTVLEYLVSGGVKRSRLSSRGYGSAKPIASDATAAGRAQNRRVELRPLR